MRRGKKKKNHAEGLPPPPGGGGPRCGPSSAQPPETHGRKGGGGTGARRLLHASHPGTPVPTGRLRPRRKPTTVPSPSRPAPRAPLANPPSRSAQSGGGRGAGPSLVASQRDRSPTLGTSNPQSAAPRPGPGRARRAPPGTQLPLPCGEREDGFKVSHPALTNRPGRLSRAERPAVTLLRKPKSPQEKLCGLLNGKRKKKSCDNS